MVEEKVIEEESAEFNCPYCGNGLSEIDVDKGICPSCAQQFVTDTEEELVIYECPHCSRSITEDVLNEGICPFCSGTFTAQ